MQRNVIEQPTKPRRSGKTLVLFVLLLPVLLSFASLVIDGSLILGEQRGLQHLADAAAMAAAQERLLGGTSSDELAAVNRVIELNNLTGVTVQLRNTPTSGPYAGDSDYLEVEVTRTFRPHLLNLTGDHTIRARAVAGIAEVTDDPFIVLLGSNPAQVALPAIGAIVPALPATQAGLEVRGIGRFHVHGAILVNTVWGGIDGDGDPAGIGPGPPWGVARLVTGKIESTYVYTSGGVDDVLHFDNVNGSPVERLYANRRPVQDPLKDLPYPASSTYHGTRTIESATTLSPGIYDWIEINNGSATFQPGVYIIRGANPVTGIGLNIIGGDVTALGVMFYFDWTLWPAFSGVQPTTPSAVIDFGSSSDRYTGLDNAASPFNKLTIFQHRDDTRPIYLINRPFTGSPFRGTVYAKSAPVILVGGGNYDAIFVADSMRVVIDDELRMHPHNVPNHIHLHPARDVFLVQ